MREDLLASAPSFTHCSKTSVPMKQSKNCHELIKLEGCLSALGLEHRTERTNARNRINFCATLRVHLNCATLNKFQQFLTQRIDIFCVMLDIVLTSQIRIFQKLWRKSSSYFVTSTNLKSKLNENAFQLSNSRLIEYRQDMFLPCTSTSCMASK